MSYALCKQCAKHWRVFGLVWCTEASPEVPEDVRRELKLYEDICRKQMRSEERVLAIGKLRAALNPETGELASEKWAATFNSRPSDKS
jgi:hypothetical protein